MAMNLKVGVIDINMGNINSVINALSTIGANVELVFDPEKLKSYDAVIFPGVGAFPEAMKRLKDSRFDSSIVEFCKSGKIFVGICLGMQLLFDWSDELEGCAGLGVIPGKVEKIPRKSGFSIPHMGWNDITSTKNSFNDESGDYYFVHSYICTPKNREDILFECTYSTTFCAGIKNTENIFGFQFHPEKSQSMGLNLLKRVLNNA